MIVDTIAVSAEELYNKYEFLAMVAITEQFGSYKTAAVVAGRNNMEINDLVQVAKMTLWDICFKRAEDRPGIKSYILKTVKWRVSDYIHEKGTAFKVTRWTSVEERNGIHTGSLNEKADWSGNNSHAIEKEKGDFIPNEDYNLEESAIEQADFDKAMDTLNEKERRIIECKLVDMMDKDIAKVMGCTRQIVYKHRTRAYKKIKAYFEGTEYIQEKVR